MSKEFNYKRAWDEYVKPEFEKLSSEIHKALEATRAEVDAISQIGATMQVTGQSKELTAMFDALPGSQLAWAHEVVYYYGHLAYGKQCQNGGLYWKFQDLASMSLINRKPYDGELLHQTKIKMKTALDAFYDHEAGTDYSDDEVPEYLLSVSPDIEEGIIKMHKVDCVNHKPDMFCIGNEHMRLSKGMYIDPTVAPCSVCKQPYSAHTSDRVMFLKPVVKAGDDIDTFLKDKKESLQKVMKHILEICTAAKIKLDGFAFVKP
jgi:hypothetical protein